MTSFLSLIAIATVTMGLAGFVGWRRDLTPKDAAVDTLLALLSALSVLILADFLFALAQPLESRAVWRNAASLAIMATPLAATLALRLRGRRSIPRALLVSTFALCAVLLWLTLRLKGVRGGWTAGEIVAATLVTAATVGFAACLGWWSKRVPAGC